MSEEYQTEEEQIEAIKRWWKENGKSIILGFVLGIGGIGGFRYWQSTVDEQTQLASMNFEEVVSLSKTDKKEFLSKVEEIEVQHAGKSYADLAAFVAAKKLVDDKKYTEAKKQLEWVINNSQYDGIVHIAKIRLVKVLLQLGLATEALNVIKNTKPSGFESVYAELRGDIYSLLGQYDKAKAEYQAALNKVNPGDRRGGAIEMKSNNLPVSQTASVKSTKE